MRGTTKPTQDERTLGSVYLRVEETRGLLLLGQHVWWGGGWWMRRVGAGARSKVWSGFRLGGTSGIVCGA